MTEISLDIDTNQRKGLGPVPMQHHKTSCSWYAWQSNIPNSFQNPFTKSALKTEPSDRFHYRIDRLVNSKKILSDSIKKSCYNDSLVGNDERNIVPVGEARNYNTFAFSQHDNRHKIKLPAKKHGVDQNIVIQSKSDNVSDTLSWTNSKTSVLPNIESSNNKTRQRAFTSSAVYRNPRRDAEHTNKNGIRNDFRRFPKSHNFSQKTSFDNYKNLNEISPILTHDMSFNSKNDNYLKPKSELMSLQNLVQPQNYSGASIPSRDRIRNRGDVVQKNRENKQPWSYAFNLKTHSALIEKNTKYACFRF